MLIRFMCDASDNNDDVYVDNVKISASTAVDPNNYLVPLSMPIDATAAGEGMEHDKIRVYPNPATDQLNVEVLDNEKAEIYINDMKGRVVHHSIFNYDQEVINIESYRTGLYNILIITPDEVFRTKFVKR
jgi:hypothetical protein